MTLVSAAALTDLLASGTPVRVLDVRWSLTEPDGRAAHEAGHIPGAVYVDLETDLSDHGATGRGRHPLPSADALEAALRRWGVDDGDTVVVYDDWNRAGSARAWWLLRAAGLDDVRILDGGWAAWRADDRPVTAEPEDPRVGSITLARRNFDAGALATLTVADAAGLARDGVLLDARAPERFRGDVEPIDPVAGHIPGAVNLPSTALLGEDGRFAPAEDLRAVFAAHGVDGDRSAGTYCGSGVTAAVVVAAAEVAGLDLALFPGSWSQWSSDPANPVETGPATD
ncbi:sulfurtransferase [Rhodococcus phenolicus]|uniref:sulfurtransferase n=1 Tax=Rhodococcus phenolicus TaxID=263849 RepID=UPI0008367599|nr:sulfurtransferase [Rhodococcus phenolicus]